MPTLSFDLAVDQYSDFQVTPIWSTQATLGGATTPTVYTGATATLMIRVNPSDATPLVSISTTPSSSGALYLGPTTDNFGVAVPAGGIEIWISKTATASLPVGSLLQYTLRIAWPNGLDETFAAGYARVRAGDDH